MMKTALVKSPKIEAGQLTREQWLNEFIKDARSQFTLVGKPLPENVRAAICPPHRKMRAIGLCWTGSVTEDKGREIWVTSAENDPVRVAGILVHELCHAALPHEVKHGPEFRRLAQSMGLEGRMTATTEGEVFRKLWAVTLARLGALPTGRYLQGRAVDFRVQKTPKMTNMACPECGFVAKVRIDQMSIGRLTCPEHGVRLLRPKERG
jgi:hypothetical protein